jgi:hypothetical protein
MWATSAIIKKLLPKVNTDRKFAQSGHPVSEGQCDRSFVKHYFVLENLHFLAQLLIYVNKWQNFESKIFTV